METAGYLTLCESVWKDIHKSYNPPSKLTVSEWADIHGVVVNGAEQGRWTTRPPQKAILDAWNQSEIEIIKVIKSARVGWTSILGQVVGYHVHQNPCSQLHVMPTIHEAEGWSKQDLDPVIEETEVLRNLISAKKTRDKSNTIKEKHYPGGILHIIGANSGTGMRRISVKLVNMDEVDAWPPFIKKEGDQVEACAVRSQDYHDRKISMGSTPTDEHFSRIGNEIKDSSRGYYILACPHCGIEHIRKFSQPKKPIVLRGQDLKVSFIEWPEGEPEKAMWNCPGCPELIGYEHHHKMLRKGYWLGEDWSYRNGKYKFKQSFAGTIGFDNYWAGYGYSPNTTPAKLAVKFTQVAKDPEKLKVFINTSLGEVWVEENESVEPSVIQRRAYQYASEVPEWVRVLTCGIDLQGDRIEGEVVGWDRNEQSANIDYFVIYGDIDQPQIWEELTEHLNQTYLHESGKEMNIASIAMDTGYRPGLVWAFADDFKYKHFYAIKGKDGQIPLIEDRIRRNERLRKRSKKGHAPEIIGVDEAKMLLLRRLKIQKPGPGYCHFPLDRDTEYFEQLTAEVLKEKRVKGRTVHVFDKIRPRNEAMDNRNYAQGALRLLNVDWEALEKTFQEAIVEPESEIQPQRTTQRRRPTRKRKSWVNDI